MVFARAVNPFLFFSYFYFLALKLGGKEERQTYIGGCRLNLMKILLDKSRICYINNICYQVLWFASYL